MHGWKQHYKEKFPGGRVHLDENLLDVHCKDGHHRVRLEKGGSGIWYDRSAEHGCLDRHDNLEVDGKPGQVVRHGLGSEKGEIAQPAAEVKKAPSKKAE